MSHITSIRPSVFARLQNQLGNVFSNKKSPSVFERLERNQKDLFQVNVLSFLSPQDVVSYLQSHKGSTPTLAMRHTVQMTVFKNRPMSTLKEIREAAVLNKGELIPQTAFRYSLTHLDCSNSDITEEELEKIVRAYPRLISLDLSGCRNIINISMLKRLTHLQSLNLNETGFQDFTSLRHLKGLQTLNLSNNDIQDQDITPLQHLIRLRELDLCNNVIQDITPLKHLTQLQTLYLEFNCIQDIAPLQYLKGLLILDLSYNLFIQDYSHLQNLDKLQTLALISNQIQDLTPLQFLIQLHKLYLQRNAIQDITPLQHLTRLQKLNLWNNPIQDITPLQHLIERPGFEFNEVKRTPSSRCNNKFFRCLEATLDRVETKIALIAISTFFGGVVGCLSVAASVGAYSYVRSSERAR